MVVQWWLGSDECMEQNCPCVHRVCSRYNAERRCIKVIVNAGDRNRAAQSAAALSAQMHSSAAALLMLLLLLMLQHAATSSALDQVYQFYTQNARLRRGCVSNYRCLLLASGHTYAYIDIVYYKYRYTGVKYTWRGYERLKHLAGIYMENNNGVVTINTNFLLSILTG